MTETRYVICRKNKETGERQYSSYSRGGWASDLSILGAFDSYRDGARAAESANKLNNSEYSYEALPVQYTFDIQLLEP